MLLKLYDSYHLNHLKNLKQYIIYSEITFSPREFVSMGLNEQNIAVSIRQGLNKIKQTSKFSLIVDLVRNFGDLECQKTPERVAEVKDEALIAGITIGGDERNYPATIFKNVYKHARKLNFHTTAHAGEACGPESIKQAIFDLEVERVGHGISVIDNTEILEKIISEKTPLEICPISNFRTNCASISQPHPIKELYDRGVLVTVNTDDPVMFQTSMDKELEYLSSLGFKKDDLFQLMKNAVDASWTDEVHKQQLKHQLEENWLN